MGKVDRLYKLDLSASLCKIPICQILDKDKVKPFVGDFRNSFHLFLIYKSLMMMEMIGQRYATVVCHLRVQSRGYSEI